MRALYFSAAALSLSTAAGCVGASTSVVAPDAHHPVSLSRAVRDRDGSIVPAERRKTVGTFEETRTAWSMFYKLIRLTPKTDISEEIDRQVKLAGGDAIVNLRVGTLHCGLNYVPTLTVVPIWPGCAKVFVRGDIIKVLPAPAADGPKASSAAASAQAVRAAPASSGAAARKGPPAAPANASTRASGPAEPAGGKAPAANASSARWL